MCLAAAASVLMQPAHRRGHDELPYPTVCKCTRDGAGGIHQVMITAKISGANFVTINEHVAYMNPSYPYGQNRLSFLSTPETALHPLVMEHR